MSASTVHNVHGVGYGEVVSSSRNGHPLAMLDNSRRGIPENPGNKQLFEPLLSYDQDCYTSVTTLNLTNTQTVSHQLFPH